MLIIKHSHYTLRTVLGLLVLLIYLTNSYGLGQTTPDLTGTWRDADHADKQVIFVRSADGLFDGRAATESDQSTKPGKIVFQSLRWNASTQTFTGNLVDPVSGKPLPVSIKLPNQDTFTFVVHKFFLRKTFTFVRVR